MARRATEATEALVIIIWRRPRQERYADNRTEDDGDLLTRNNYEFGCDAVMVVKVVEQLAAATSESQVYQNGVSINDQNN